MPHDVKADGPSLLFFILNQLIGRFEPDLVQLDSKLGQIQLALLGGSPPGVEGELIRIRRELSEAVQALGQIAANISSRPGQFINILTVISAIFLPLTFVTGYFGMNFGVITMDMNKVWLYVLLGILLPAACVAVTLVILQRLIARMGIQSILPARPMAQAEPPGHARPPA